MTNLIMHVQRRNILHVVQYVPFDPSPGQLSQLSRTPDNYYKCQCVSRNLLQQHLFSGSNPGAPHFQVRQGRR
jgi:hypothetical protein